MDPTSTLSIVVPVSDGSRRLGLVVDEIRSCRQSFESRSGPVSITKAVVVVDESKAQHYAESLRLASHYEWVQVVTLSRDYGRHGATAAGALHTSSDWVVTVDEPITQATQLLSRMLATAILERVDVVYRDNADSSGPATAGGDTVRLIRGPIARAAASVARSDTNFDQALSWHTDRTVTLPLHRTATSEGPTTTEIGPVPPPDPLREADRSRVVSTGIALLAVSLPGFLWPLVAALAESAVQPPTWLMPMAATTAVSGTLIISTAALSALKSAALDSTSDRHATRPTFNVIDRSLDLDLVTWAAATLPDQPIDVRHRQPATDAAVQPTRP